jgi:hypothetical protein
MAALISKPGITPASVLAIPKTWDGTWFRGFIGGQLTGADVRNAIAGPGITITGNLSTPYATISAGGAGAPFNAPIIVKTTPGGVTVFEVFNSITGPTVEGYGPTAGGLVDMTPDTGTFTVTYGGISTNTTATCTWYRIGKIAIVYFASAGPGAASSTAFTATGIPAALQPATLANQYFHIDNVFDNSAAIATAGGTVQAGSGTVTFSKGPGQGIGWTNAGTKGFSSNGFVACWLLS